MDDFLDQVNKLADDIKLTSKRLDEKSIWLFLATLGCWSVTHKNMQLFAMAVVVFYLIEHVIAGNFSSKSYNSRIREIERDVLAFEGGESKKNEVYGALQRYCKRPLENKEFIKKNYKYIIAAIFYAFSLAYFLTSI